MAAPGAAIQRPDQARMVMMHDRLLRPSPSMAILGTILALLASLVGLRPGAVLGADPSPGGSSAILVSTDGSAPGPWSAAATDVEIGAGERAFGAWLLYPERDPGADPVTGPAAIAEGPWPVVVFGHGYLAPVELYAQTLRALASHGFVVVAPRSGGELFPDHGAFAADLSAVIDWLEAEQARPDSPLAGALDLDRIAASGHSMGGGAAILATAADPRIRTVATLAAAETRPSAIGAAADVVVPSLLIAGELDAIAPVATHQRPIFEATGGAPAQLRTILGGSHCGFTDVDAGGVLGGLSELVCDAATIPPETQRAMTVGLLADWLRLHLGGMVALEPVVWPDDPGDGTTVDSRRP